MTYSINNCFRTTFSTGRTRLSSREQTQLAEKVNRLYQGELGTAISSNSDKIANLAYEYNSMGEPVIRITLKNGAVQYFNRELNAAQKQTIQEILGPRSIPNRPSFTPTHFFHRPAPAPAPQEQNNEETTAPRQPERQQRRVRFNLPDEENSEETEVDSPSEEQRGAASHPLQEECDYLRAELYDRDREIDSLRANLENDTPAQRIFEAANRDIAQLEETIRRYNHENQQLRQRILELNQRAPAAANNQNADDQVPVEEQDDIQIEVVEEVPPPVPLQAQVNEDDEDEEQDPPVAQHPPRQAQAALGQRAQVQLIEDDEDDDEEEDPLPQRQPVPPVPNPPAPPVNADPGHENQQNDLDLALETIGEQQQEIDRINRERANSARASHERIAELQETLHLILNSRDRVEAEKTALQSELEQTHAHFATEKNKAVQRGYQARNNEVAALQAKIDSASNRIRQLETEINKLDEIADLAYSKIEELEDAYFRIRTSNAETSNLLAERELRNEQIANLRNNLRIALNRIRELEAENAQFAAERAHSTVRELEENVEQLRKERAELLTQVDGLRERAQTSNVTIQDLRLQNESLQTALRQRRERSVYSSAAPTERACCATIRLED